MHIAIIQLYLRAGEPFQSPLNAEILANLFSFLDNLKAPFVIGGDWQNPPADLAAMVVQSKFKAQIKAIEGPTTLHGSQLDYFLISNGLQSSCAIEPNCDIPWKPHCAMMLTLNTGHAAIPVQQLRSFPPIGRAFQPPKAWPSFPEKNGPFFILNYQITGLGTDLARWCTQSEFYLTQQLQAPRLGRGFQVDLYVAPLQGPHKAQLWKKGRPAFSKKIAVRVNVLHRNPHADVEKALRNMIEDVSQHASENFDKDDFALQMETWLKDPNQDPQNLQVIIQSQEHQAHIGLASVNSEEYRTWLQTAHSAGAPGSQTSSMGSHLATG